MTQAEAYESTLIGTLDSGEQAENGKTYYLDHHNGAEKEYCVCQDEFPMKWFDDRESAQAYFLRMISDTDDND